MIPMPSKQPNKPTNNEDREELLSQLHKISGAKQTDRGIEFFDYGRLADFILADRKQTAQSVIARVEAEGPKDEHGLPIDDFARTASQVNEYYAERDGHDRANAAWRAALKKIREEYL